MAKQIEFRQLCALAKSILLRDPSMGYTDWKDQTLLQLSKWRFALPETGGVEMLARAMLQVEFAVYKTLGPRSGLPDEMRKLIADSTSRPVRPEIREGRTTRPAGWDVVQQLIGKLEKKQPTAGIRVTRSLPLTEVAALSEFWTQASDPATDRLALVRAFAEIAIIRSTSWNPKRIRAEFNALRLSTGDALCFTCYSGRAGRAFHHVIQIQNGGSNHPRNRIPLCELCHRDVHPWLEPLPRRGSRWFRLSDVFAEVPDEPRKQVAEE